MLPSLIDYHLQNYHTFRDGDNGNCYDDLDYYHGYHYDQCQESKIGIVAIIIITIIIKITVIQIITTIIITIQ